MITEHSTPSSVTILGGGLAGCEAAWQLAQRGHPVRMMEMRPSRPTAAHRSGMLAELVCSNSMGSLLPDRALGILKNEMRALGSLIIETAHRHAVPAGSALAISRDQFSEEITEQISRHRLIDLVRQEATEIPEGPTIVATGPLTSPALNQDLQRLTGGSQLYFYDAMAPIVTAESIDMGIAFRQSRYDRDADGQQDANTEGDYINCPLGRDEYEAFVATLLEAPLREIKDFEKELERYFEGCMPIEVLAARGRDSLAYGPMRPVGLRDPRTGRRPHAVVQLRQDNVAGSLFNLVGFQTNVSWGAQKDLLRMIPGLGNAEFVRLGQMHRNTFICSPELLQPTLQMKSNSNLFFAGQITGTEGYVGSTLGGLVAGLNMNRVLSNQAPLVFPTTTMTGALLHYITHASPANFQPMKSNMGLLPDLEQRIRGKRNRGAAHALRAREAMEEFISTERIAAV